MGFDITDRISLNISTQENLVLSSIEKFKDYIINETLTKKFHIINAKGENKILDYFVDTEIKKI